MIQWLIIVGYLTCGVGVARWTYGRVRPSTAPLCGPGGDGRRHRHPSSRASEWDRPGHSWRCYTRNPKYSTFDGDSIHTCITENSEAVMWALGTGLLWAPYLTGKFTYWGLGKIITEGHRPLPAEVQAAIRRLENEERHGA